MSEEYRNCERIMQILILGTVLCQFIFLRCTSGVLGQFLKKKKNEIEKMTVFRAVLQGHVLWSSKCLK